MSASSAYGPIWVAYEEGYFQEQGLDVSLTAVQPVPGAQALIAGDFDLSATKIGGCAVGHAASSKAWSSATAGSGMVAPYRRS